MSAYCVPSNFQSFGFKGEEDKQGPPSLAAYIVLEETKNKIK